jgi:quercetin dioxygenase-like cupin family protein
MTDAADGQLEFVGRPVVLAPGEGHPMRMANIPDRMLLKADGEDTGQYYSTFEYECEPHSRGVPLHLHERHEEGFYILEGALEMQLDDRVITATAGSFVLVPRGFAHRFGNPSDQPCRFLAIFSPAGYEKIFDERTRLLESGADAEALRALDRAHRSRPIGSPADAPRHL